MRYFTLLLEAWTSEDRQLDAQELLWIGPEILHQQVQLARGAVQIVVQLLIYQELANSALAGIYLVDNRVDFRNSRLELVAQVFALEQLSGRAFAGVEVVDNLVHALGGILQLVIKRRILEELAGRALPVLKLLQHVVNTPQRSAEIIVQLAIVQQNSKRALVAVQRIRQVLHLAQNSEQVVVQRLIHQKLADTPFAALHQTDNLVDALHRILQRVQDAETLLHQILYFTRIDAWYFLAGHHRHFAFAGLYVDVFGPQHVGRADGGQRIAGDIPQLVLRNLHFDAHQAHRILRAGQPDCLHLSDRNPIQIYRRAVGERGGIRHVRVNDGVRFENIRVSGDQKNENGQNGHGEDREDPHLQSRPGGPVLNRHT